MFLFATFANLYLKGLLLLLALSVLLIDVVSIEGPKLFEVGTDNKGAFLVVNVQNLIVKGIIS